jgi:hypothetical protein
MNFFNLPNPCSTSALASNKNEYHNQKNAVVKDDDLTAICEPIVQTTHIFNTSQPYRPPRPVTRIALLLPFTFYLTVLMLKKKCQSRDEYVDRHITLKQFDERAWTGFM